MDKFAIVDLEMTSSDLEIGKIIQIGCVFIEDGEITHRYKTNVNPEMPIPREITRLTKIKDADVRQAPTFGQIGQFLRQKLDGYTFVAHNVDFDYNALNKSFEKYRIKKLREKAIDTVTLAQIFFPTATKYKLSTISREFGISLEHAHSADGDAEATAKLFWKIYQKMHDIPVQTLNQVFEVAVNLPIDTREFIGSVVKKRKKKTQVNNLVKYRNLFLAPPAPHDEDFAYEKDERIMIATSDELYEDELEVIGASVLSSEITPTILKTPNHYLNLAKFVRDGAYFNTNRHFQIIKARVLIWLLETQDGDVSELSMGNAKQLIQQGFTYENNYKKIDKNPLDFLQRAIVKCNAANLIQVTTSELAQLVFAPNNYLPEVGSLVIDSQERFNREVEALSAEETSIETTIKKVHSLNGTIDFFLKNYEREAKKFKLNNLINTREKLVAYARELDFLIPEIDEIYNVNYHSGFNYEFNMTGFNQKYEKKFGKILDDFLNVSNEAREAVKKNLGEVELAMTKIYGNPERELARVVSRMQDVLSATKMLSRYLVQEGDAKVLKKMSVDTQNNVHAIKFIDARIANVNNSQWFNSIGMVNYFEM